MNWNNLTELSQLEEIKEASKKTPIVIFKHSTRCSISSMALNRLERSWDIPENSLQPYLLDLITYRNISNTIADIFEVEHQSPQLLLIIDGKATYNTSHMSISLDDLKSHLA